MPRSKRRDLHNARSLVPIYDLLLWSLTTSPWPLLLNAKQVDNLLPQIFRFHLRLAKYDYIAQHVPGKLLYVADVLSRASIQGESEEN